MRRALAAALRRAGRRARPAPRRSRPSARRSGPSATPPRRTTARAGSPPTSARQRPDRFLYLGDVYEDGTAREFRAALRPALRLARADHRPDARQPRVGEPLQRLLPVLARQEGTAAAALVEHEHRRLADPLAQLDGRPRAGLAPAALAAAPARGGAGRLPHRLLAPAPLQRGRPTRTTRAWRRSGTRCAGTPAPS